MARGQAARERLRRPVGLGRPRLFPRFCGAARSLEALLQPGHEVDDLLTARPFLRRLQPRRLAFDLRLYESFDVLCVFVGVLLRIPVGREILDERRREIELLAARVGRFRELERVDVHELVRESHHREHERVFDDLDGGEVLAVAEDDFRDPGAPCLPNRLAQERVAALGSLSRQQVVRRLEITLVDRVGIDEIENVDRLRLLQRRGPEVVLRQDDELSFFVLVALDQIFPGHRFALALAHALVVDRRFILRVEQPEARTVVAHGRMELDGDVDEAERDCAFPDRTGHRGAT